MRVVFGQLRKRVDRISIHAKSVLSLWRWTLQRTVTVQYRFVMHRYAVMRASKHFDTVRGRRFLELASLLQEFLLLRLDDLESATSVASQLLNVLKHCDQLTYEESGTAEAYVLLHFLDRYHRFQMIFDSLHRKRLMPMRSDGVRILDVGTGPGPSMFAASDFYIDALPSMTQTVFPPNQEVFSIDYVERSHEFRNWLHHFTEFVNCSSPTQKPWLVPYHHGTFVDFQDLDFNTKVVSWERDDDGETSPVHYVKRHRFDLIVFSNFLTTKEQTASFSKQIEDCARYLRNNGILVVVGAKSSTEKYKEVYNTIEETVLSGRYSTRKLFARCYKVQIDNPIMSYSWNDPYGERLKQLTKCIMAKLQLRAGAYIPKKAAEILERSVQPEYSRAIEWELLVFRKKAKPRQQTRNKNLV